MNIEEILDSEKRNEDNLYDIHFYMEGSFWRAYEWSAYLSKIFPSSLSEKEMCNKLNFYRIYDCGLIKYIWNKQ